ncbi:MAG: hypothetical protein C0606_09470 [Hyphomicrobiales bacterium]|nr:MAG: hypothetical protein C0606_09470 [Hyphomicrobiales bacterium]
MDSSSGNSPQSAPLVDSLYGLLTEPDGFEQLVQRLSESYSTLLEQEQSDNLALLQQNISGNLEDIEHHFDRAARLFDRINHEIYDNAGGSSDDENAPYPVMLINARGIITYANRNARTGYGLDRGDSISALPVDAGMARSIEASLRRIDGSPRDDSFVVLPVYHPETETRSLFTLSPEPGNGNEPLARLQQLEFGWNGEVGTTICESFGLTAAEQEILRAIVEGRSFADLANARQRSVETVRTQARSLFRKTGARSQLELIRMFGALSIAMPTRQTNAAPPAPDSRRHDLIEVEPGRRLQVDLMGPDDGLPVIMLHGLFSGTGLTADGHAALHRHGLRIIAPWRPRFAESDAADWTFQKTPYAFADDIKTVMDRYGIKRAVLMGRFTGALYAAAAARVLGPAIAGVVVVAGTPPIRSRAQLDVMAPMQRLYAYSARYFPTALPILTRGLLHMIMKGPPGQFFDSLYQKPEEDVETSRDPEVRAILTDGTFKSFGGGSKAYETDVRHTARDWSDYYDGIKQPTLLLHGRLDPVTTIDQVHDIIARFPALKLIEIPDAGQLFLYSRPDFTIGTIAEFARPLLDGRKSSRKRSDGSRNTSGTRKTE